MPKIYGNTVGAGGGLPKSYILETEDGAQLVGVLVGEETVFTATDNDVRKNLVYAGDKGVSTGTKVIPAYHTHQGVKIVTVGSEFNVSLPNLDTYDYTKFQALICDFNSNLNNSVATSKVAIDNKVYEVLSVDSISNITKNNTNKTVDFGIVNETDSPQILRFFTYKEIE